MDDSGTERKKTDRRTNKTKKAIKNALMDLTAINDISKITVKDIADLADITRKTFYSHYADIPSVLDDIENEIVKKISTIGGIVGPALNPYPFFKELTELINEETAYCNLLINSPVSITIFDKIKKILKSKLIDIYTSGNMCINDLMLGYVLDFTAAGLIGVYKEWFYSDKKIMLEDLTGQINLIVFGGLNAITI